MELIAFNKKLEDYKFSKFDKAQRSSFKYWINHWKAFNLVAVALHVWKPKYLLHDIEKPWLMFFWKDYNRVQIWHRTHNNHHFGYKGKKKLDPEAMIIDWECSRFTKNASPLTAREEANKILDVSKMINNDKYYQDRAEFVLKEILPMLDKLGLEK